MLKKVFRIFFKVVLSLLVLILVLWVLLQTSVFQNFLISRITRTLSRELKTTVSIQHVDFDLFDRMRLEKTLVLDRKHDTLLYAGALRVNITDWFFLKKKIELRYIGLDDAVIKTNRQTPEWNYQFIVDYFSSGEASSSPSKPVDINLRTISLRNVTYYQNDNWVGTDRFVSVKDARIEADQLDIARRSFNISLMTLDEPVFAQYEYKGLRPPRSKRAANTAVQDSAAWNADNWKILAKAITITNGKVAIQREGKPLATLDVFDENNIVLSALNASLKKTLLTGDTLTSDVSLRLKDRGGFEIRKFTTRFRMTPAVMEFASLDIETPKSRLRDYFAMHYKSFNEDMQDFIHKVAMSGNFRNSIVDSDELAYFAPDTRNWKTIFNVSGDVAGPVDNLTVNGMSIRSGKENILAGDASLRGLPDLDKSFIDFRVKELKTSMDELSRLAPSIRTITQPDLRAFGNIRYTGSLTGYLHDFVTFGNLSTQIGNLKTDVHLKVPKSGLPVYSGRVSATDFNLGKFINNRDIGAIAFTGSIDGKGFTNETMNIKLNGTIRQFHFSGYDYTNIEANGVLKKDEFSGSASINDPNLRIDTIVGAINFGDKNPFFNLTAGILTLNTQKLGFTLDDISLTGDFDLNFKGKNIDNFLGYARVSNALLLDNGKQLSFDSLVVSSAEYEGRKILALRTNELEVSINGSFKIMSLPTAFQLFLNKYYPAYIEKPKGKIDNQDFSFMIHARNISEYVSLFDKNLSGFNESVLEGQINIADNNLKLDATIPRVQYHNITFNDVKINGLGNSDTLGVFTDIDDVVVNDSLHSPGTKIGAVASNDVSDITISTSPINSYYSADLSARVITRKDGFKLTFNPSVFVLNQKKWTIQQGGEIELIDKMIIANNVRFSQNGELLTVSTQPSDVTNSNDVLISLKDINVGDFLPFFLKSPRMDGLLSGDVRIEDPFAKLRVNFNTTLDQFSLENDTIGLVKANGNYDQKMQSFYTAVSSDNAPNKFHGNFLYQERDSLNPISGAINFERTGLHVLESFLQGIASDVYGYGTGILNISGRPNSPKITGAIKLDSASLQIDYTRCKYKVAPNSTITFREDEIDFGTTKLLDRNNRTATLTGKIYHNFFDNFFFNEFHVVTGDNFQLLHTTEADNDQFYGDVTGQAELVINGFTNDMRMDIKGQPTDSSHIFLPIGETVESGGLNYIEFIQFGREVALDRKSRDNTNIRVNMELTANPLATVDVILDEATGDVIKAQGSGKLFITVGTRDPLTIRGRYTVEEGQYTFNFQTFFKTPFTLQQGFIEWQGDPYQAQLNIDAVYKAQNVNLSNIPTSTGFSNISGDIDIIFKLRGTLKNPNPQFEFQFPFDNPIKSDPIASEFLKTRFQTDNNEMLNQVASLLLFNTFLTTDQGAMAGNMTANFVGRTAGQIISARLTSSLNGWLQKLLKTNSVNFFTNINTTDLAFLRNANELPVQNIGKISFRYAFPNNKFILNVGSNVNYRINPGLANSTSDLLFTPDISFEMLISPSGNFRVIGFNRSDFDPVNLSGLNSVNRTGVQLSYRKDFESFEDFFTGRRRK